MVSKSLKQIFESFIECRRGCEGSSRTVGAFEFWKEGSRRTPEYDLNLAQRKSTDWLEKDAEKRFKDSTEVEKTMEF